MKLPIKILLIVLGLYVALVAAFESWLGYSQPRGEENLVITLTADDGSRKQRVLSLFESQGELYLAANHWPRAWFRQVKQNPEVHIEFGGAHAAQSGDYTALPVEMITYPERIEPHGFERSRGIGGRDPGALDLRNGNAEMCLRHGLLPCSARLKSHEFPGWKTHQQACDERQAVVLQHTVVFGSLHG